MEPTRVRRLAREGTWILLGQVASVAGALVLVRVLTGRLDPTEYGHLAIGLTVAGLVNQVVMGGVSAAVARFYSIAAEAQDLPAYLRSSRRLMAWATAAVGLIGLALIPCLLALGQRQWVGLAAAALALSIASGYNAALGGIQNAARQRAVVALHSGLDAWLKILLVVLVLAWLGRSAAAVVVGYLLSTLLVTGSQLWFLGRLARGQVAAPVEDAGWFEQMGAFARPFLIWGAFSWAQQSSDRWALERFDGAREVGLYAVLFQLGYTPIAMATGLAMAFLGPIFYQRAGDATDPARNANVHRLVRQIASSCLLLTGVGALLAAALHGWLFRLLVAAEYRAVSHLLPWMVVAGGLFSAGQLLALKLMSDLKAATMTWAKIVTAALGVALNIGGAWAAGLRGSVAALVAFSAIYFLWMVLLVLRAPPAATPQPTPA